MKVVNIVFSPTGGTKKVADIIAENWSDDVCAVDLCDPGLQEMTLAKENLALIAVPSYGGRVPALAAQRLAKIKGNQARCVIVCVYGNRAYEDTLVELEDIVQKREFQVMAAVAAVAEHSIMHQYATGRPDGPDREALQKFAEEILEKYNRGETSLAVGLPGNRPYKKAGGAGMVPKANSDCNGCGLCAEQCPAQAISRDDIKTADAGLCISCMRCVAQCPQSARKINGVMVSAAALAMKKVCSVRKENELYV